MYALEYGIRFNTIKEVDRLPEETKIKKDKDNAKATITESWKNTNILFSEVPTIKRSTINITLAIFEYKP